MQSSAKSRDGLFLFSAFLEAETHLGQALQRVCEILCGFLKMFCCLSEEAHSLEAHSLFICFLSIRYSCRSGGFDCL